MTPQEIGQRLVELCRGGRNLEAIDELYADDVVSAEAADPPEGDRVLRGIEAVKGKNRWWMENHEIHDASVKGPYPHGDDRFAVIFTYEVTFKPADQRFTMEEVAHYTVNDGRIVQEEFFYAM